MRKITALIFFAFALAIGLGTGRAQAQNGTATFNITSTARYTVFLKFYSLQRRHVWPGGSDHWTLDDSREHSFRLACNVGEAICFGGGYSQNGTGRYWGVGFLGDHNCSGCCLICGADNPAASWTLEE